MPARFRTFSQVYAASLGSRRFRVVLLGFFGITALLLAATGVFGELAYSVSRRTREIGVRIALGASSGEVLRMILNQVMRTIVIGVAIGMTGGLALTRTVQLSPTLKKRRNLDRLSTDGQAAPLTGRPAASSV